jgi:hypothetical protein
MDGNQNAFCRSGKKYSSCVFLIRGGSSAKFCALAFRKSPSVVANKNI